MIVTILKFIMCQFVSTDRLIRADQPNMTARITVDLRAAVHRDNLAFGKSAIVRISPLCILTTLALLIFLHQVTDYAGTTLANMTYQTLIGWI